VSTHYANLGNVPCSLNKHSEVIKGISNLTQNVPVYLFGLGGQKSGPIGTLFLNKMRFNF
jgi:hypothetical protein